jgi:hypothetical protein
MWLEFKKYNNSTLGGVLINLAMAVGIIILLAVVYFYAYLPSITNHNESITVPNIEGMTIEKLEDFLGKRNLLWEVNDSSYSPDAQPLTVLKQFPHPGGCCVDFAQEILDTERRQAGHDSACGLSGAEIETVTA